MPIASTPGQPDNAASGAPIANNYLGHKNVGRYGFAIVRGPSQSIAPKDQVLLTLNPQQFEQGEEGAAILTPMQGGSKKRERRGNLFKDISLSGTTGFMPLGAKAPTTNTLGSSLLQGVTNPFNAFKPGGGVTPGVSGYASFLELRRLFRTYWDVHKSGSTSDRTGTNFIFFNPKDNETWLVEPMSFRMSRDRGSPMTYRYQISLKTIQPFTVVPPKDPLADTQKSSGLLYFIDSAKDLAAKLQKFAAILRADLNNLSNNVQALVNQILSIVDSITGDITDIAAAAINFIKTPLNIVTRVASTVEGVFVAAEAVAINLPVAAIESLTGIAQVCDSLAARPDLFQERWRDRYGNAITNFNQTFGIGGDSSHIAEAVQLSGVRSDTVLKGESFLQMVARLTKDPTQVAGIVVVNDLKYPYLSPSAAERAPNTLAPGDTVLVPTFESNRANQPLNAVTTSSATPSNPSFTGRVVATGAGNSVTLPGVSWRPNQWAGFAARILSGTGAGQTTLVATNTPTTLTVGAWRNVDGTVGTGPDATSVLNVFLQKFETQPKRGSEELMGVDLALTSDFDLALSPSSDLATIRGPDNFNQAIGIKFRTTQGDLIANQWFGVLPPFGEKGSPDNVFTFRYNATQTLLSDSRVESVDQIEVNLNKDKIELGARVAVVGGGYQQINEKV